MTDRLLTLKVSSEGYQTSTPFIIEENPKLLYPKGCLVLTPPHVRKRHCVKVEV